MNTRQTKTLAILLALLLAGLTLLSFIDRQNDTTARSLLFPDLKARINDATRVVLIRADERLTVTNESGDWTLVERDHYPVDTGKLRQALLALADATRLEEKTSDPDRYGQLGVEDTSASSTGTEIHVRGPDLEASVILGNVAQRSYRYARIRGEATSWLIDQNPDLPDDAAGWLLPEIIDIDAARVRSVTITHGDGESIHIEKETSEASAFEVPGIPAGRELSYPSVVNGMAGVLGKLNLQDVARADGAEAGDGVATTEFRTFEGMEITVRSEQRDNTTWVTIGAAAGDAESDEAAGINERLGGWAYQIQSYKGDQLRRRWDDILKAEE